MYNYKGVKITWLGHDGFKIEDGLETLVIDPFKLTKDVRADYVLLSHEHFDHCNSEDLKKVLKQSTIVVAPAIMRGGACKSVSQGSQKSKAW